MSPDKIWKKTFFSIFGKKIVGVRSVFLLGFFFVVVFSQCDFFGKSNFGSEKNKIFSDQKKKFFSLTQNSVYQRNPTIKKSSQEHRPYGGLGCACPEFLERT